MKRKIFTLIASVAICAAAVAEKPTASVLKTTTAPEIDGTIDAIWAGAPENAVALPFGTETPSATAYWKALWDDGGIYVLVAVTEDDIMYNAITAATGDAYAMDKCEVYFDVVQTVDNIGAAGGMATTGHAQYAPDITKDVFTKELTTDADGLRQYAYKTAVTSADAAATNGAYTFEYYFPFGYFEAYAEFDQTKPMGFDVVVSDNDGSGRNRLVWANDGKGATAAEDWNNLDDAGTVSLSATFVSTAVNTASSVKASAYVSGGKLVLKSVSNVSIYDVTGKLVAKNVNNGASLSALKSGLYLVKGNNFSAKVIK